MRLFLVLVLSSLPSIDMDQRGFIRDTNATLKVSTNSRMGS